MELNDSFEVAHPAGVVWKVLTDVEQVAPCLPGAQITGSDGDTFEGLVKVKLGPVTSQYTGTASFVERDDDAHRLVMSAGGRDTRGAGNASAVITVSLEPAGDASTTVSIHTDLTVTGKVAQFGRGVLAAVSRKLMAQFAGNLAALIAGRDASAEPADPSESGGDGTGAGEPPGAGRAAASGSGPATEVEAADLLGVAGAPLLKRFLPAALAVIVVVVVVVLALAA